MQAVFDMLPQIGMGVGALVAGLVWALRQIGWIKPRRQEAIEPRAEQMWRSEAEAQKVRADRLEEDLVQVRAAMDRMKVEIDALKARPDLSVVLERLENHHIEVMAHQTAMIESSRFFAEILERIATAVVPPVHLRD